MEVFFSFETVNTAIKVTVGISILAGVVSISDVFDTVSTHVADNSNRTIVRSAFSWDCGKLEVVTLITGNSRLALSNFLFNSFKAIDATIEVTVKLSIFASIITRSYIGDMLPADIANNCNTS